ncbi:hypothetical protein KIPB_006072 [Kipferlia bialata]|uniref:TRAF-type domain-containing protein n=1 Tax=Kipferlia bialata TaxID=797122 RepID=A0A9K3GJG9_9EUKA|nr:hypothetical protein KIPB_006072 [Kipferlia bialata]|eukprot:g6072.t1
MSQGAACPKVYIYMCPVCGVDAVSTTPAHLVASVLDTLEISCPFNHYRAVTAKGDTTHKFRCKWRGKLGSLSDHLIGCPAYPVKCPKCHVEVGRHQLGQHLKSMCPEREVACPHCQTLCLVKNAQKHLTQCQEYSVPCPNDCGEKIRRKHLDAHQDTCPKRKVSCPLPFCNTEVVKSDLSQHLSLDMMHYHLAQLGGYFASKADMYNIIEAAREENSLLRRDVQALTERDEAREREITSLREMVAALTQSVAELKGQR